MVYAELIDLIDKKDSSARQKWFETFYDKLSPIAHRYAKSGEQAEAMLPQALHSCYEKMNELRGNTAQGIVKHFISECVSFIKNIRSEYFVSSTVYATSQNPVSDLNLFDSSDRPDLNAADAETLVVSLQKLVPAQRLIFNLHVIDGYSLSEAADLLESSEATVKSNLEKARFNLQKNVENSIKNAKS